MWFYRVFGSEFGPIDEATLRELHESGTVSLDDDVRRDSDADWSTFRVAVLGEQLSAKRSDAAIDIPATESGDDAPEWFCLTAGQELGPLSFNELLDLAKSGVLDAEDQVKFGAQGKFRRLGSMGRLVAVLPFQESPTGSHKLREDTRPAADPAPAPAAPAEPATIIQEVVRYHPAVDEVAWFAWIRGVEYGPVSLNQLSHWQSVGHLAATDFVRRGVFGNWLPPNPTVEVALSQLRIVEKVVVPAPALPTAAPAPAVAASATHAAPVAAAASAAASPPVTRSVSSVAAAESRPVEKAAATAAVATVSDSEQSKPAASLERTTTTASLATPKEDIPVATVSRSAADTPNERPTAAALSSGSMGSSSMSSSSWSSKPMASGYGSAPVSRPAPARKKSSGGGGSFDLSALTSNPAVTKAFGGLVAVAVVVGLYFVLPASTAAEREKLEKLQKIVQTFRQYREDRVGPNEWTAFTESSLKVSKEIAAELKDTASRQYPVRQALLWASRDRLPEVLQSAREKPTPAERELDYHLQKAAFLLGSGPDPDASAAQDTPDQGPQS